MPNWTRNQSGAEANINFWCDRSWSPHFDLVIVKGKNPFEIDTRLWGLSRLSPIYCVCNTSTFYIAVFHTKSARVSRWITWILPSVFSFTFLLFYFLFTFIIFYQNCLYSSRIEFPLLLPLSRIIKHVSSLRITCNAKLKEALPFHDRWCGTSFYRRWFVLHNIVSHPITDHALYPLTNQN